MKHLATHSPRIQSNLDGSKVFKVFQDGQRPTPIGRSPPRLQRRPHRRRKGRKVGSHQQIHQQQVLGGKYIISILS